MRHLSPSALPRCNSSRTSFAFQRGIENVFSGELLPGVDAVFSSVYALGEAAFIIGEALFAKCFGGAIIVVLL
jgi:hypothetical protein